MIIESTDINKQYIRESINVTGMISRLIRKPSRRLLNYFVICPLYLIFCTCILIWMFIYSRGLSAVFIGACSGIVIALMIFMGIRYLQLLKAYHMVLKEDDRHITYKFSEKEIEYDNNKNKKFIAPWESFQCMRVIKNGIYFIPKNKSGILIGLQIENLDRITEFIAENNIKIKRIP